jgi:hypothetical protein
MAKITRMSRLPKVVDNAVKEALDKMAKELNSEFEREIRLRKWEWPRATKRKNGERVTSPRDIVDTTALVDSQKMDKMNPYEYKWVWEVDYSAIVHDGGKFKSGGSYLARPWTKSAEEIVKPQDYFADILRRELNG